MKLFLFAFIVLVALATDLHFNNGKFRIMQVTDTHYADYDSEDEATTVLLDDLLSLENADLVVITGDLVSGIFPLFCSIPHIFLITCQSRIQIQWHEGLVQVILGESYEGLHRPPDPLCIGLRKSR